MKEAGKNGVSENKERKKKKKKKAYDDRPLYLSCWLGIATSFMTSSSLAWPGKIKCIFDDLFSAHVKQVSKHDIYKNRVAFSLKVFVSTIYSHLQYTSHHRKTAKEE